MARYRSPLIKIKWEAVSKIAITKEILYAKRMSQLSLTSFLCKGKLVTAVWSVVQQPGDLVTSLRETGEKILLQYPIRQPAGSRIFFFFFFFGVCICGDSQSDCWSTSDIFCRVSYHDWNCAVNMRSSDLNSWEVSFSSTVNLFFTWMEAIWGLESHNM